MKIAPVGRIGAYRHHKETASIVSIQKEGSDRLDDTVAMMFCVNPGSEQEATMDKMIRAYNSHEVLVQALREIKGNNPFRVFAPAEIAHQALTLLGEE